MFHIMLYVNPVHWTRPELWVFECRYLGWGFSIGPLMVRCGKQWKGHKFLTFIV